MGASKSFKKKGKRAQPSVSASMYDEDTPDSNIYKASTPTSIVSRRLSTASSTSKSTFSSGSAESVASQKIPRYRCCCNWSGTRCKDIYNLIHTSLPPDHVWCKAPYSFNPKKINNAIKKTAFQNVISMLFEALLSKEYVEKYYDCFLRSTNRGFMTLVNENYFEFGFNLIKKIALAVTRDKLENDIHASEEAKKSIMEDTELQDEFMDISRKYNNKFLEDVDSVKKVY